jgi:hypothetical protein
MTVSSYISFFLNSKSSVVHLETLEISHPSFSQVYFIVRNAVNGLTAMLEDGVTEQAFVYYPVQITPSGAEDDLDQILNITFGDLGEMLPQAIDRAVVAGTMSVKPVVTYRVYRSDDLSGPVDGPFIYEISNISTKKAGATFQATAPKLNLNQTGEAYRMDRFPMLRAFT